MATKYQINGTSEDTDTPQLTHTHTHESETMIVWMRYECELAIHKSLHISLALIEWQLREGTCETQERKKN